jgi:hypothetical protein
MSRNVEVLLRRLGISTCFERCAIQSVSAPFSTFDAPLLGRTKWPTLSHAWIKRCAVDVLGGAPENPGLSVVHYASSIEDTIDWLDEPDNTSVLLIPSSLFGPDVMARCRLSSSNTTVLLMGQFKSYTVGNKESLDAETVVKALTSLHPDHWFKTEVCYLASLLSSSH